VSAGFRLTAWACILLSALSSMIISYAGLAGLARLVGYGTVEIPIVGLVLDAAALLPVGIDVAIVASTLVWLGQGAPSGTTSYARRLALVTIATSVLANATYHGLIGGKYWWLASVVASIPPAFLAALVHLGALLVRATPATAPAPAERDDVRQDQERDDQEQETAHQDAPELAPAAPEQRQEPGGAPGDGLVTSGNLFDEIARRVREAEAAGLRPPGRGKLARQLDVSEHDVRKALELLHQERAEHLATTPVPGQ